VRSSATACFNFSGESVYCVIGAAFAVELDEAFCVGGACEPRDAALTGAVKMLIAQIAAAIRVTHIMRRTMVRLIRENILFIFN